MLFYRYQVFMVPVLWCKGIDVKCFKFFTSLESKTQNLFDAIMLGDCAFFLKWIVKPYELRDSTVRLERVESVLRFLTSVSGHPAGKEFHSLR